MLAPIDRPCRDAGRDRGDRSDRGEGGVRDCSAPDAERFFQSIFKVRARAVPNARSSATLGQEREGTGVVIGDDGLIVTIGYLIVEADEVSLVDQQGKVLPARVVAYDHATGLGLVRAVVPLSAPTLPLGDSSKLADRDPVMVVNHAGPDDVTLALVVSTRPFTGNWEYLLERAIFTSPPTMNWSGAALVSRDLKLVGIGSLDRARGVLVRRCGAARQHVRADRRAEAHPAGSRAHGTAGRSPATVARRGGRRSLGPA